MKKRFSSLLTPAVLSAWKWISRRPHWASFLIAFGASLMAWFADHSVLSVMGSAVIAGCLAHLAGEKISLPIAVSLAIQLLLPLVRGDKPKGLSLFGIKFWIFLPAILLFFGSILGIFFGGAMLVGNLTERTLADPDKEPQNTVLKPVMWFGLSVLVAILIVGLVSICGGM